MTDPVTLKRPKPKEDENEILRLQEEFIQSKEKPSVHIAKNDQDKIRKTRTFTSQFSANKKLKCTRQTHTNPQVSNKTESFPICPENLFPLTENQNPPKTSSIILGNIIERKLPDRFDLHFSQDQDFSRSGFPSVFTSKDSNTKNESLFWQTLSKTEPSKSEENQEPVRFEDYGLKTEEDILREKSKLESMLDPSLLEFVKQRKRKKDRSKSKETEVSNTKNEASTSTANFQEELPEMVKEMISEAKEKHWIHMDVVESEKAKWMEDIPSKDEKSNLDEPYNARFDFDGVLLPFKDEKLTIDKGLHHHGQEPERPGYSLQELLQLSRSSSAQQRSIALQTLAKIIEKSRRGWYDSVLDPAPLSALNEKNVFLLLRFSIDDSSVSIVTSALQAMRAFLYNEEDEVCLDRLFGLDDFSEPILKPDLKDVKDTSNLKDHELAQLDTVATALRSDIVPRIRYILNEMQPPPDGVSSALEILIRLARHSHESALNILWAPHLLEIILKHFIPLTTDKLVNQEKINNAYGVPVVSALRFCRVLITYAGKAAADKLSRCQIVQSIVSYVSSEAGTHGTFLHIESLRLWKLILLHGFAADSVSGSHLILRSQLRIFFDNLNLGQASDLLCEHASALILVASHEDSLRVDILQLLRKWSTQLVSISSPTWGRTKLVLQALIAVEEYSEGYFQTNWISNSKLFVNLKSCSNLLSGFQSAKERSPSSLPSLGALTENGQLQPVLSHNSCLPFLAEVLKVFAIFSQKKDIQRVYDQPEFVKYISELSKSDWTLENSWYTRVELHLLARVVTTGRLIEETLSLKMKNTLWILAVKLISALPADFPNLVKEMLRSVLDPKKMSMDELLKNLQDLKLIEDERQTCLKLSKVLITIYESYVALKGNWDQAAMPKDWIFLPLIDTYSISKKYHKLDQNDTEKIIIVLNLYLGLPELVENLTPNLRFSRLILVFLCDTVFHDETVSHLVEKVVAAFLKRHNKELDFSVDVPGLSSFTDMFTALCENFFSNSYGNDSFAIILLSFTSQRHNVHFRRMLWSEHAGTLRYIKVPLEKLILALDEFLYPLETDVSVIECYITSLVRGNIKKEWCPVPYIVALHHSAMFVKQSNKLAIRMRAGLEKLKDSRAADELLNYDPSMLGNFV
ncbi:RNA polymerase II-associated protein 1 [Belonocnema kinseyi]|uniref:RNA polymerase II-associated protein 1 n=1 Tax=Belonocnema kinseyi TaxID=2817044 RepID=UPI00143DA1A7|nr:RNA polymerase II-associated protein 1 [Belonocnema kinseyi]